jgi:hypothetical protein
MTAFPASLYGMSTSGVEVSGDGLRCSSHDSRHSTDGALNAKNVRSAAAFMPAGFSHTDAGGEPHGRVAEHGEQLTDEIPATVAVSERRAQSSGRLA